MRGAFTDAKRNKLGRIATAEGGTSFLDEIGELAPSMQVKLLRVLQGREYEALGSNRTVHADIRVVAATNADLVARMEQGLFRQDLFYRLNVVGLQIPPLRDRREDIPRLVERFVSVQSERTTKDVSGVSEEAMAALMSHGFPGNVRELENAIEHAFVLCRFGQIELHHLPSSIVEGSPASENTFGRLGPRQSAEAQVIRDVLKRCGGNRARAAQELAVHRTTLWRKLRAYGIE